MKELITISDNRIAVAEGFLKINRERIEDAVENGYGERPFPLKNLSSRQEAEFMLNDTIFSSPLIKSVSIMSESYSAEAQVLTINDIDKINFLISELKKKIIKEPYSLLNYYEDV